MSRVLHCLPSLGAVAMLALPVLPVPATVLHMKMCAGRVIDLPVSHGDKAPRGRDCPAGCHAPLCQQRKRAGAPSV